MRQSTKAHKKALVHTLALDTANTLWTPSMQLFMSFRSMPLSTNFTLASLAALASEVLGGLVQMSVDSHGKPRLFTGSVRDG